MAERRVPRIRFKGFEEDWEQRKLDEMASFSKGIGYSKADLRESGTPVILYGRLYTRYETTISVVDTFVGAKEGTVSSRGGEVIVPASGETAEEISIASVVGKPGILLGGDLNIIIPSKDLNSAFLAISVSHARPHDKLTKMAQGKSVVHLHNTDLRQVEIDLPSYEEQQEISNLFETLDSLLSLHQRKLEKLKILKKAMLEKMFPKNGAKVPEIRFSGFTDDWEQRKLGELADIVGGGTPSTSNPQYWDGDIDWYAPAEINEQVYVSSSQKKITRVGYENSSVKLLPVGTVLFTSRAGIGKTAILAREACTNQGFQSIVPHKQELDSYFIFSRSAELKQYGEIAGAGSTFVEVSGKQMSEMELMMPLTLNEQQAIGSYFRRLDQLLSLHQRKLEKLRQIKKSMLERMFV